ncbi:MAG TPA: diaminopimelate epimerase [Gemmatimonadales bacterium]
MRGTVFYKMSGSGNDFVILDGRSSPGDLWSPESIRAVCDRRRGAGADGLVILTPATAEAVRMSYWNSDGSRAAMCGNAALCSGRLAAYLEMVPAGEFCLLTDAGPVRVRAAPSTEVAEINLPDLELLPNPPTAVPATGELWMSFLTVGNPHVVVRVEDIEKVDVPTRGKALRFEPVFGPAGANINFVSPAAGVNGLWLIRTYERGVEGETLACGTGTVAAALALAHQGEARLPTVFRSRGGPELTVRASLTEGKASEVWLVGQGRLVYRGVWDSV